MSVQFGVNNIIYFMDITASQLPLYYVDYNIIIILVNIIRLHFVVYGITRIFMYTKSTQLYNAHYMINYNM